MTDHAAHGNPETQIIELLQHKLHAALKELATLAADIGRITERIDRLQPTNKSTGHSENHPGRRLMPGTQDTDFEPIQAGNLTFTFGGASPFATQVLTFPNPYATIPFVLGVANTAGYFLEVDGTTARWCNVRCCYGPGTNPAANTAVTGQWLAWNTPGDNT